MTLNRAPMEKFRPLMAQHYLKEKAEFRPDSGPPALMLFKILRSNPRTLEHPLDVGLDAADAVENVLDHVRVRRSGTSPVTFLYPR